MDPKINSKDTELQHEDMPVGFCWGAVIPLWHLFNGTWRVGFLYWFYVYVAQLLVIYVSWGPGVSNCRPWRVKLYVFSVSRVFVVRLASRL